MNDMLSNSIPVPIPSTAIEAGLILISSITSPIVSIDNPPFEKKPSSGSKQEDIVESYIDVSVSIDVEDAKPGVSVEADSKSIGLVLPTSVAEEGNKSEESESESASASTPSKLTPSWRKKPSHRFIPIFKPHTNPIHKLFLNALSIPTFNPPKSWYEALFTSGGDEDEDGKVGWVLVPNAMFAERSKEEEEEEGDAFVFEMMDDDGEMEHSIVVVPGLRLGMNVGPGAGALFGGCVGNKKREEEEEDDSTVVEGSIITTTNLVSGSETGSPANAPSVEAEEEENRDGKIDDDDDEKAEVTEKNEKVGTDDGDDDDSNHDLSELAAAFKEERKKRDRYIDSLFEMLYRDSGSGQSDSEISTGESAPPVENGSENEKKEIGIVEVDNSLLNTDFDKLEDVATNFTKVGIFLNGKLKRKGMVNVWATVMGLLIKA